MSHVAKANSCSTEPESHAERKAQSKNHKQRHKREFPRRQHAVPSHDNGKKYDSDAKIENRRAHGTHRKQHARKVNLGKHCAVAKQTFSCTRYGTGEQQPRQESGENQQRVWGVGRWHSQNEPKDCDEDKGSKQGAQNRPGHTKNSLRIADADVAPCKYHQQIAIVQNFCKKFGSRPPGLDQDLLLITCHSQSTGLSRPPASFLSSATSRLIFSYSSILILRNRTVTLAFSCMPFGVR